MFITKAGDFHFKDGRKLLTKDIRASLCPLRNGQGSLVATQEVEGGRVVGEPTVTYYPKHSDAVAAFEAIEAENGGGR